MSAGITSIKVWHKWGKPEKCRHSFFFFFLKSIAYTLINANLITTGGARK